MSKLAMYVFIDAFGYEVYKRYGFLNTILTNQKPLKTVFGFSSACDPSILTGRYPVEHGHWSSFYFDPENSPFKFFKYLSFLPKSLTDRWRVRHQLSKMVKKIYGFTGYFELYSVPFKYLPYFDYLEKKDYFVPRGILKTDTIFDFCVDNKIPYFCSDWRLSEEQNIQIAQQEISKGEISLLYLYLPKLDAVMHQYGTIHEAVELKLHALEENVIACLENAQKQYDDVSLYVLGDHGMTNVSESVDLISMIDSCGVEYGKDYIAMYDSTMGRFWFLTGKGERAISEFLKTCSFGYTVTEKELREMNVFFEGNRFGDIFFLMNPGKLIVPSYFGLSAIKGMHGYHPNDKDSYPLFASNQEIPQSIQSITDIRKTMEHEIT